MYLLRKAHVRDYDRVSKTGALEHIRAHEDSRVRSYARKIVGSRDSYDLHQIRRDRFGHLPHWNSLNEHTRQAILDAEEEKAKGHREFEEWVEKHGSKKGKKKEAEKVDRSGWEQQLMFKSGLWLLRKSNINHEPKGGGDGEKGGQFAPRSVERDVDDFEQVLWNVKMDTFDMTKPATVMHHTPEVLQQLGATNRKIDIDPLDIKKIILPWTAKDGKHGIPIDIVKNIPRLISEPVMVFDSNTQPNSLVVLTETMHGGSPLYVIVQMEKRRHGRNNIVNRISSSYVRPDSDIERWVKAGLLRMYDNKKGSEWLRSRGLQLPTDGTSLQSLSKKTLLLKSKQVNYIIVKRRAC